MSKQAPHFTALAAAIDLPVGDGVPEWVHLLPTAKGSIQTYDGRGPYRIDDAATVIAASMVDPRGLLIDENHSTDLAAPMGGEAPARGWIVALEARADGIWGKVDWNPKGVALLAERAYRGLSPVFVHDASGKVIRIKHAALTNKPNLQGLTALHSENAMSFAAIAKAAGLGDDATEAAIIAAIGQLGNTTALQASQDAIKALQTELTSVTTQLTALQTEGATSRAAAFVDGAIAQGKVGVKPLREHYIAMHAQDPARVEKEIGALPALGGGSQITAQPPQGGEITALNAEQVQVADQLGLPHDEFLASLQADAKKEVR